MMTEKVTLEFYTRTLNDASLHTAQLCVYLFKRARSRHAPVATDTLLTNKSTAPPTGPTPRREPSWPAGKWERGAADDELQRRPIYDPGRRPARRRAQRRARQHAPADAIPIMYDHPKYPTRLEVDTSTPIDGG